MTQAILLQSISEIVTIGLLFTSPAQPTSTPVPAHEKKVLAEKVHKEPVYYTVQSGQTLDLIANEVYDKEIYWTILWNDNESLTDPAMIHAGDKLLLRNEKPTYVESIKRLLPTPTVIPTPVLQQVNIPSSSVSLDQLYMDAGNKFGVAWQILYGIHMVETAQRDGPIDSGFGPQGPMQFLPSNFLPPTLLTATEMVLQISTAQQMRFTQRQIILQDTGSIENGLKSYGNAGEAVKRYATARGWNP